MYINAKEDPNNPWNSKMEGRRELHGKKRMKGRVTSEAGGRRHGRKAALICVCWERSCNHLANGVGTL